MLAKARVKKHRKKVLEASFNKLIQLHNANMFLPKNLKKLTTQQKYNILNVILVTKKKRDRSLKGRTCANRHKQRIYEAKD